MICKQTSSLLLISLIVLVLFGCEGVDKSSPTSLPPEPTSTVSPVAREIDEYITQIVEFDSFVADLEDEYENIADRYHRTFVTLEWKLELESLFTRDRQLLDSWLAIKPPEPLLGFHETLASALQVSQRLNDHYSDWLSSFGTNPSQPPSPWGRGTEIGDERIEIINKAKTALDHGKTVYAAHSDGTELRIEIKTLFQFGDLLAKQIELSLIPTPVVVMPTPIPPTSVTLALFNSLRMGMSHSQVRNIVGLSCELISEVSGLGSEFDTAMYQCDGSGLLGANMNYMIQGGKLISKAQFGLR